ncbi:MAG: PDZ domain-containing protein [Myxococcales bacterium]|nr:PDZ domain-containing protein [Myxococcales bacterium]
MEAPPAPPRPPVGVMAHPHAARPLAPLAPPRFTWGMATDGFGPRLGTRVSDMTPELRAFFGAPDDAGLLVQGIEPGSAAQSAKIQVGDVLVTVDGEPIARVTDVRRALADHGAGDAVEVEVVRKKKRKTLRVTLTDDGRSSSWPPGSGSDFDFDFDFELPPEAERHLDPQTREHVQRQLEHAREQLRAVERTLEALEGSSPSSTDGKTKPKGKAKPKGKTKPKGKAKPKQSAPATD